MSAARRALVWFQNRFTCDTFRLQVYHDATASFIGTCTITEESFGQALNLYRVWLA